ncbi:hypothetical protein CR513_26444, partial [Mucuna pruriens]
MRDINHVIGKRSQDLDSPIDAHYHVTLQILSHLKDSPNLGIFFPNASDLFLKGFSNLDWAACKNTIKKYIYASLAFQHIHSKLGMLDIHSGLREVLPDIS